MNQFPHLKFAGKIEGKPILFGGGTSKQSDENRKNRHFDLLGDYLVSVKSALGEHPNPRFQLKLPESNKAIFYGIHHFEIHYHSNVAEQIVRWFYPPPDAPIKEQVHEYRMQFEDLSNSAPT